MVKINQEDLSASCNSCNKNRESRTLRKENNQKQKGKQKNKNKIYRLITTLPFQAEILDTLSINRTSYFQQKLCTSLPINILLNLSENNKKMKCPQKLEWSLPKITRKIKGK